MKHIFKNIVLAALTWCATMRLTRLRRGGLQIIGITGSIGKTTCKEAVAHVLNRQWRVLKSNKGYNTEFGLPLTILELESEFSSPVGWMKNLILAFWKAAFDRTAYDILVLEMGVDKPGDMDVLLRMVTPDIGIFTGVHPVHLADGQFGSLDAIFEEKAKLIKAIQTDGMILMNQDDTRCAALGAVMGVQRTGPKVVMFGIKEPAKLQATRVTSGWGSVNFFAEYGEVQSEFQVPILGTQHVSSLLSAIGCGLLLGMYMPDIAEQLSTFRLPPGRLSLIEGIRDSWIIDSSYNASPDAVRAALTTLGELAMIKSSPRKIFVFGNMNELGASSEREHRGIAPFLVEQADVLVTVGDMAKLCADEALAKGILTKEQIHTFPTTSDATAFMGEFIQTGDLILVKGSQNNIRLERLVKAIMKDPKQASRLLARQEWKS